MKRNMKREKKKEATQIQIGYDLQNYDEPIEIDIKKTGHICLVGGTGSGKSIATLYTLYKILCLPLSIQIYIGDFKRSGDYKGITNENLFAEFDHVTDLIEKFYFDFQETPEGSEEIKILLLDEYAGYIVWLTQHDKKKCDEIKGKISEILMLGRSRMCYYICVQQRITAQLFPSGIGAIDNFQVCIGLGRLSPDSRKSLFAGEHFEDEEFERTYKPKQGQGLCLVDGQPLKAIGIPYISDKEKLKKLLRNKANRRQ